MTQAEDEALVRGLMRETARAFLERDLAALGRVLADDFTFTDAAGVVGDKERWLADVASGDLQFESIASDALDVKRLDEHQIRVRGQLTLRAHYSRGNYNGTFRYLGLFTNHGGAWQLQLSSARVVPVTESPDR